SQQLLNEIATARVCLLSSERRARYDDELRKRLAAERKIAAPPPPSGLAAVPLAGPGKPASFAVAAPPIEPPPTIAQAMRSVTATAVAAPVIPDGPTPESASVFNSVSRRLHVSR